MNLSEIRHRFAYHPPVTEERRVQHENVRDTLHSVAQILNDLPEGREKSIVFTKLEEAMFWANAAVARAGDDA